MAATPDLKQLMEQAQKMQQNMQKAQQELAEMVVVGEAGNGMVKIWMSGRHEAKKCQIDLSLMDDDKDILEDLVVAAINSATNQIEKKSQEKIINLTQGLQLPPDMQLPTGKE
jgi:hypothetical protein